MRKEDLARINAALGCHAGAPSVAGIIAGIERMQRQLQDAEDQAQEDADDLYLLRVALDAVREWWVLYGHELGGVAARVLGGIMEPVDDAATPPADVKAAPIPMVLHCPECGLQHVDTPEPEKGWTNPPHKSHLCHGCGCVWRPADAPTNGVRSITTRGKADTWPATDAKPPSEQGRREGRSDYLDGLRCIEEMLLAGAKPREVLPDLVQHLRRCAGNEGGG